MPMLANLDLSTVANTATPLGPSPLASRGNMVPGAQGFLTTDKPSPGSSKVWLEGVGGKSTLLGVGGSHRSLIISVTENSPGFSLPRNAHSFHYREYMISEFVIPLFPELSFHNSTPLLPYVFQNRLLFPSKLSSLESTSDLKSCPSCLDFHKSTATRAFPFFAESCRDISLYDFDTTVILPLEYLTRGGKAATDVSCSAYISKIWIHPAHHNFHDTIKPQKNIFALKKLRSGRVEDFKREARALYAFAAYPHDHIVRLLAAFRHDGSFYFLFPWARGGSLRSFWRGHPQPTIDTEVLTWVAKQSLGIAAALHEIHHQHYQGTEKKPNGGHQGASLGIRGYHGDIKPENILLFEGDRQGDIRHVWKIGDFGVSRKFLVAARGGDIPKGFTPTYQSPEHQIEGRIDGCADIWSLGCVFLETVVWLLWGWNGLVRFGIMRQTPNRLTAKNNIINSDTFFDIVDSTHDNVPVPILKPAVLQCIESLCFDLNVSPYLTDLLHLIRCYLLDVNKHSRLSSERLVKVLRQLHRRCVDTPAYTVAVPRPQKPPLPTTFIHCESNNRCIADLSTSSNILTSKTIPQMILTYITNSRDTALRTHLHRDRDMALGSGTPTSSQWLDDYISQQLYEAGPDSSASEPYDNTLNFSIPEETYPLPPNFLETQPSRKRVLSSITDPNEEDCDRKTKHKKRGKTLQRNLEINPPSNNTSLPSNALNIPQLASPSTSVSKPRMFACPFFKRSGDRYLTPKDWKCCLGPGPGWTIHRLKEHLYRKHTSPNYQCPRCLVEFEDNSNLRQHQRNTASCIVHTNTESGIERIDAEQVVKLKKKTRRCSDEEKWNDIYRIIFPLDPTTHMPSPYYEDISHLGVDSLSQFQSYLQNRLQDCHETQQNTSTIQACIELIKGFRGTGDFSLPLSEAPSLVFSDSAFSTMSYEPDASTTFSMTDKNNLNTTKEFEGMTMDDLAGFPLLDDSLETRFNEVFGL
ncbi:kinase-like domain-containing protein [Xylaria castorea]|nr:kinase-like domain-containing protein [Xylaria castorea]